MMPAKTLLKPRRSSKANGDDGLKFGDTPAPSSRESGRYLYGILPSRDRLDFGAIGIGDAGEPVYTLNYRDLAAVVSNTPVYRFEPSRENALAHEHVIETAMTNHTVIPMSFGAVFRADNDIREVLKSVYSSLKDVLDQMARKLEFGLKVNWDRDRIIEDLKQEDIEIRKFHREILRKHIESTFVARMQLGRMIDRALGERSVGYVREIYEALGEVCVVSRDNQPIGDKMIMNAAFLVERDRQPEFDQAVNKIAKKCGERLKFRYTGPWPPYNFVNIRLKLERAGAG